MSVFQILQNYREAFARGLLITLEMSVLCWGIGLAAGVALGFWGHRYASSLGRFIKVGSFFLASIPLLILLYWCHYPLQELAGVVIDPFVTSVVVLSLINTTGVADLVRHGLQDFPSQYLDAARVCGIRPGVVRRMIVWPLVFRQLFPALLMLQVQVLQMTLFTSLISVNELFREAQRINSVIYKPIEIYTALALFYLAVCAPLNGIAYWFRRKYHPNLSER